MRLRGGAAVAVAAAAVAVAVAAAAVAILRGESVCCHCTRARIIEYNFIAWVEQ